VAAGGFILVKDGVLRFGPPRSCQAPEHIEGKEQDRFGPPRSCDPNVGFSQAPEHVKGEGSLLYEDGGGSARLVADDCLKHLFI
jgi:hypothetical protein